jgi:hypothetical protein
MLGQPVYFLTPDVVGFELTGRLREGVTATDLVLTVTEILRRHKVVGKFVEFFGEGTRTLACPTAPPSPTWRPSTAPRWASSRSTRRRSTTSRAPAARKGRDRGLRGLLPRPGPVRRARRARSTTAGRHARPGHRHAQPGRPEAPAGPHRARPGRRASSRSCSASGRQRTTASTGRPSLLHARSGTRQAVPRARPAACRATRPPPPARRAWWSRWSQQAHPGGSAFRGAASDPGHRHGPRQRRRADRRHHQLHQHQQPQRAAGRRPAGQEGGGGRAEGASRTSRPRWRRARASSPNTSRRPACCPTWRSWASRRRLRLHHLHRQCRRPDARDQRGHHRPTTWSAPPCCRATATSRRASTPT